MNRRKLIERAAMLSAGLNAASVSRSELSPYANVLFHTPGTWEQRRAAAMQLLGLAGSAQMANRSRLSPQQNEAVKRLVLPILQSDPGEEEIAFLLVWTMRMLVMRKTNVPVPGAA